VAALLLTATLCFLPRPLAVEFLGDGGPLETVTLGLYAACVLTLGWNSDHPLRVRVWILVVILLLVALEANPGGSIKALVERPPVRAGDPVRMRWWGALVLAGILAGAFLGLFLSARGRFLAALRARRAEAWLTLAGAVLVPVALLVDRYNDTRLFWNRGYRVGVGVGFAAHLIEELAETLTAACALAALLLHRWRRRQEASS
jgi:hypothetical protein